MAGLNRAKAYEALVMVALQQLKGQGKLTGEIFWNQTPKGLSIEPDFTIGPDVDHPEIQILVTHSGSAKNSDMKFWRNMGELVEAKTCLATVPRVVNVAFDSIIKESLKGLQTAAFDGQMVVGDRDYGVELISWVDRHLEDLPTPMMEKAEVITGLIKKDESLHRVMQRLGEDMEKAITSTRPELDQLWAMERKRKRGEALVARETYVRRGLSKFLIYEDTNVAGRLYRGKKVKLDEVPDYAYDLGLARKSIGKVIPADEEIWNAVGLLNDEQIEWVTSSAPMDKLSGWLLTLRNIKHLEFMGRYVLEDYEQLCDPEVLSNRLFQLHNDPWALVESDEVPDNWPPETVWLLEYLIELIKASTGSANGYGYAQLSKEISEDEGPARDFDQNTREYLLSPWGHLSEWLHRKEEYILPTKVLHALSAVIVNRIANIPMSNIASLVVDIPRGICKNIVEAKLCTHRSFEPLWVLIQHALPKANKTSIRTCFAEKAGLGGQAGKTTVAKVKNTFINWQSAFGNPHDKRKELCGRAVALRYSWDSEKQKFIPRPGVKKLILILDGTWRQQDLDALVRSGWDEIYYPDEMDKLAEAII